MTETYFAEAREYLPQIGRFAAEDVYGGSIAVPYSQNRYSYCYNNPLVLVDGDGRKPTWKSIQEELDELGDKAKKGVSNVIRGFEENFWRKYIYGEDILLDSGEINGKPYEVNGHRGADVIVAKKSKEGKFEGWSFNLDATIPWTDTSIEYTLSGKNWKPNTWKTSIVSSVKRNMGKYGTVSEKAGIYTNMEEVGYINEIKGGIENLPQKLPDGTSLEDYGDITWSVKIEQKKYTWEQMWEFVGTCVVGVAGCIAILYLMANDVTVVGAVDDMLILVILGWMKENSPLIYKYIIEMNPNLEKKEAKDICPTKG